MVVAENGCCASRALVSFPGFAVPLNDLVEPFYMEHKILDNLTQVHLVSNRMTVSITSKKQFTSELDAIEDPRVLASLWEHTRVGSLPGVQVKEFVDFLPQYAKLIPIVYWTYEGRHNVSNCHFDITGQEYMTSKLGEETLMRDYTSDGSHLNKAGSKILLNEYLLTNTIFKQTLEENMND